MWNTIMSYWLLFFFPITKLLNVWSADKLGHQKFYFNHLFNFFIVPQVDYEMALDYAMQSGVIEEPREAIYLNSLEGSYKFVDLQSLVFVFRFVP